jgi:integrase
MRTFPAGRTLKEARIVKDLRRAENQKEHDFDAKKLESMTLSRWGQIYLETYACDKKSLKDDVRHVKHLCRILGANVRLAEIKLAQVEQFKQVRKREAHRGKPISETTIDRTLEVLRHLLRIAEQEEIIGRVPQVKLYKPKNERDRVATDEEYQRLLAASAPHLQRIVTCAYETAMRTGEIRNLTWAKVDWKTGFIRLRAEDTKERRPKNIPISPILQKILTDLRREHQDGKIAAITGHVFTWKRKPMKEGWKTAYKGACRRSGIVDLHFHDLRHTFITRKVRAGWDYKRIMAITGHSTFAVFQRYNNPSEDDIRAVVLSAAPQQVAG